MYIKHGMKSMKLHTVYQFGRMPKLSKYKKYKEYQRAEAKTNLEKSIYNLMTTFFYGKLIERIKNV